MDFGPDERQPDSARKPTISRLMDSERASEVKGRLATLLLHGRARFDLPSKSGAFPPNNLLALIAFRDLV